MIEALVEYNGLVHITTKQLQTLLHTWTKCYSEDIVSECVYLDLMLMVKVIEKIESIENIDTFVEEAVLSKDRIELHIKYFVSACEDEGLKSAFGEYLINTLYMLVYFFDKFYPRHYSRLILLKHVCVYVLQTLNHEEPYIEDKYIELETEKLFSIIQHQEF